MFFCILLHSFAPLPIANGKPICIQNWDTVPMIDLCFAFVVPAIEEMLRFMHFFASTLFFAK